MFLRPPLRPTPHFSVYITRPCCIELPQKSALLPSAVRRCPGGKRPSWIFPRRSLADRRCRVAVLPRTVPHLRLKRSAALFRVAESRSPRGSWTPRVSSPHPPCLARPRPAWILPGTTAVRGDATSGPQLPCPAANSSVPTRPDRATALTDCRLSTFPDLHRPEVGGRCCQAGAL